MTPSLSPPLFFSFYSFFRVFRRGKEREKEKAKGRTGKGEKKERKMREKTFLVLHHQLVSRRTKKREFPTFCECRTMRRGTHTPRESAQRISVRFVPHTEKQTFSPPKNLRPPSPWVARRVAAAACERRRERTVIDVGPPLPARAPIVAKIGALDAPENCAHFRCPARLRARPARLLVA